MKEVSENSRSGTEFKKSVGNWIWWPNTSKIPHQYQVLWSLFTLLSCIPGVIIMSLRRGRGGEGERGCCIWLVQYYVIQWATAFLKLHSMVQDYMIPWWVSGAQGTNTVFQYFPRILTKSWISSVLLSFCRHLHQIWVKLFTKTF